MERDELLEYYRSCYFESEKRFDDLVTVVLGMCVVILFIIMLFSGDFATGM